MCIEIALLDIWVTFTRNAYITNLMYSTMLILLETEKMKVIQILMTTFIIR